MFLITGAPRSGTAYTAAVLRAAGLDVGHEQIGRDGCVSWLHACPGGTVSWRGKICDCETSLIVHQVREPLACISSMLTLAQETWDYMARVIDVDADTQIMRAMKAYVGWNRHIETFDPLIVIPVEYLGRYWEKLAAITGTDPLFMPDVPKDTNSRVHPELSFPDLVEADPGLANEIRIMAEGYGYIIDGSAQDARLTVCIMARDEEEWIGGCLESVRSIADHIIVLDTGSTDRTMEIAKSYGAEIHQHPWQHDFSFHRNQLISWVQTPWLMMIDCDERFDGAQAPFKKFLRQCPRRYNAVLLKMLDHIDGRQDMQFNIERVFRAGTVRFENAVHNKPIVHGEDGGIVYSDAKLHHYGYGLSSDKMAKKQLRTIVLLNKRINTDPNDHEAWFYLSQIRGMQGNIEQTIEAATKHVELGRGKPDFHPAVYYTLIQACLQIQDYQQADQWISEGLNELPQDVDIARGLLDYGIAVDRVDFVAEGARRFIQNYDLAEANPAHQQTRFTYRHNLEDLAFALFHLGSIQMQAAMSTVNRLGRVLPACNADFRREMGISIEKEFGRIGVNWTNLDVEKEAA